MGVNMRKHQLETPQHEKFRRGKRPIGTSVLKKSRTQYVWLNVLPDDLWLKVRQGETVWGALKREGVELESDCGGLGKCGKCKVRVLSSIGPPSKEEEELLDEEELKQGIRLACRTEVDKDFVIHTEETDFEAEYFQILKTGHRPFFHTQPLINKRLITLPPDLLDEGISEMDRIKMVMVPEYQDLVAPIHCLRTLPERLDATDYHGAAVLHENSLLAWQDWEEVDCHFGLVYDLGTSTLVGKLISLIDGSEVAVVSCLNSQMKYGSNVISRLKYLQDHANGLERFHNLLINDLNRITTRLLKAANLQPNDVFIAVAAGNTTMQHFLLTLDPSGIAEAPFSPVLTDGLIVGAAAVGLELHPEALCYVMPTKSGYIGGDLISVILTSGAWEQEDEIILGLDLGTNGEIFLGNHKRLLTCSAAAGPALEGATISHGMIAKAGAIEGVSVEADNVSYQIIGNIKPKGVCGSGLVDLVAVLLHCGYINHEGLLRPPRKNRIESLDSKMIKRAGVYEFLIASAEESYSSRPMYLTQKDIRELQLAKAAVAAGIQILMNDMGIVTEDIKHVYLAGALGNYVDPLSAIRTGLIPRFNPEIVTSLGNAASTGASMALLSKNYWRMANELSDFIEHVELSSRLDFNEFFVENMDFPKGNIW